MGSSARKKREKKKDFEKPKLKVGKAKPKAANHTSTSFKAKGIVLSQQSLHDAAPASATQLSHNLSLLNHHSANTRRESLSHITTVFVSSTEPPIPYSTIVPALAPVVLDSAPAVRTALLTLLNSTTLPKDLRQHGTIPAAAIKMYTNRYLLYIHSAMTHISADVRADSTNFLDWLLNVVRDEGVRGVRGWGKTLKCWMVLLGWESNREKTTSTIEFSDAGKNKKAVLQHLTVLGHFLSIGLTEEEEKIELVAPHQHTLLHIMPTTSNIYAHLSLFSNDKASGEEGLEGSAEDADSRKRIFKNVFLVNVMKGLESKRKEGGEIGRVAGSVVKIVNEAMKD